jgi:hypothetical protein
MAFIQDSLKSKLKGVKRISTILLALLLAIPLTQKASAATGATVVSEDRTLRSHQFLRTSLVGTPFVTSLASLNLEYATASLNQGIEQELSASGFSPSVLAQFGLERWALELRFSGTLIVGSDSYSALVLGGSFSKSVEAAVKYMLINNRDFVLTAALSPIYRSGTSFSPIVAAAGAITTPQSIKSSNFFQVSSLTNWYPRLMGAAAFSPVLGGTFEVGKVFSSRTSEDSYRLAAAGTINFDKLDPRLHFGAAVFGRVDSPSARDSDTVFIGGFGLYEMFRKDFNVGAEFSKLVSAEESFSIYFSATYYY